MAYDPFYSSSPSDSGLLDDAASPFTPGSASQPAPTGNVPQRGEYDAPEPRPASAEAPEESLRDVPMPDGFLSRLRGIVNDL